MTLRKKIYFTKNGVHILKSHLKKKDKIQKMGDLMRTMPFQFTKQYY